MNDSPEAASPDAKPAGRINLSRKKRFLLIAAGFLLAFFAMEIALRIENYFQVRRAREEANVNSPEEEYWPVYDPDLGYRLNPKFGDHNPDGLRDHPVGPKENHFRVLFLGDSLLYYGDDLDDTVSAHLRSVVNKNPAFRHIDVTNAGIKGYTNYQELLYLKKYGLNFEPDLVGIGFCLNDLFKFLHSFNVENGKIIPGSYRFSEEALNVPRSRLRRLKDKSFLIVWLENKISLAGRRIAKKRAGSLPFETALDIGRAWQDEPWKQIESQLEEFVALQSRHHFRLFVVSFPVSSQYKSEYLRSNRDYVLKPQRKLKEICERLGIPLYDLYPDMNAGLFSQDRIHLTKPGRKIAGALIAKFLIQSQLLPKNPSVTQTD